jgi:hypothetical protein
LSYLGMSCSVSLTILCLARKLVTNLKLIILGLGAMLATALLFTAIGDIITRPGVTETQTVSQVTNTLVHSSETPIAIEQVTQPVLQLTLPTRPASRTMTPTGEVTPVPSPPADASTTDLATSEPYPLPSVSIPDPYPPPVDSATDTALAGPTQTTSPPATPVLGTSAIRGRILFGGELLEEAVLLNVENQELSTVQQITSPNGDYIIYDLLPSVRGYSILFSQDINLGFSLDQVVRWGTVRASPVLAGDMTSMPDLEIGLLGLQPVVPLPEAVVASGPVNALTPLRFEWAPYPSADQYWVELRSNRFSAPVWDSGFINATVVDFTGTLWSGAAIQPGTYWWSVGARVNERAMTISGPVWEFTLDW